MPVLTKSVINRLPKIQRRRRETDIVYKACYHEAQRQGLWVKHASVQSTNFKASVLPKLAAPIIERYKALGKVSPDFTVEVFSQTLNGESEAESMPQDRPMGGLKAQVQPTKLYSTPKATLPQAVTTAVSQFKSDSIDGLASQVDSLKAQISEHESDLLGLINALNKAETALAKALDGLTARYRKAAPSIQVEEPQELDLDMPVTVSAPKKSKRSTKRRKA